MTNAKEKNADSNDTPARSEIGPMFLAASGIAAAFGVASCCALPILLGSLGLGTAWLGGIAFLAAPYRLALLAAAIIFLLSSVVMLIWQRRTAAACTPGKACVRPMITAMTIGALLLGAVLIVLGFIYT
jgi:mercuric ion transport protein